MDSVKLTGELIHFVSCPNEWFICTIVVIRTDKKYAESIGEKYLAEHV